jgi:AGCS family alanine or glycine:cation symporter
VLNFVDALEKIIRQINQITWGPITIIFVLFVGIWFTFKLNFFQILKMKTWTKYTFGTFLGRKKFVKSTDSNLKNSISPFQAMTTALGGCVGTGNIVGVSAAVLFGGPGALFWMWFASFFGMMTAFAENVLAIKYRRKSRSKGFYGGPMVYMEDALKCKWLAVVFCIACVAVGIFNGGVVQTSSICTSFKESFGISSVITAIAIAIAVSVVIFGGIKRIASVTEKLVPFMSCLYILCGLTVVFCNLDKLGNAFVSIFSNAFDFRAVGGSIIGCAALQTLRYGSARGLISNEAGLGTSPIIHALSSNAEPVKQGMWGIFQVFIDTFVICSITGLCILVTGAENISNQSEMLTNIAFKSVLGSFGEIMICLLLVLFGFSTILSCAFQGERCLQHILGDNKTKYIKLYKVVIILMVAFSFCLTSRTVWEFCDLFSICMMLPNLFTLLFLSKKIVSVYKSFLKNTTEHEENRMNKVG